ncbi:hypothetical protein JR316_0001187 [Psilocybe cubensis]|uniref:Uncharacterized protein n=2 Tax=Psilocybe cubensis TaxID=181762 RepID=A0ACB8HH14_PSICU|nr:hypothetical protein JR316_0001187 [Psilocybe cubensis]KAH9487119.1 hypothetical protein JR316_0001187 [Psilocybe cubensis]
MAQPTPESKLLSDSTGQEVKEQVLESAGGEVEAARAKHVDSGSPSTPSVAVPDPHLEKNSSQNSANAQSNATSSRPSLVPLGSGNVQTSIITPVAPHPKRFSAVNINKKFLEKNTASGTSTSSGSSSITKSGSPATRPAVQPTSSHSRLVTAKLTASPAVASTTAGWSRPSSVAPSPATNSPNSTSPMPIAPVSQPSATAAPQLPHAGKVILPQPRNAVPQMSSSQKDNTPNKPVWGNVKPPVVRPDFEPSDFPTAAEVANVTSTSRKQAKAAEEAKATSDNAAKLLRSEEADAFRGVHLDPNVHHWDEMEEDDDNFLGGVIEFGDGRQYKIESSESNQPGSVSTGNVPRSQPDDFKESTIPVSKEDRFVDDFDRSWPKSRNSPASVPRDVPPHSASPSASPVISHTSHSPQDSSRVLFNERSNRLEPYSQTHRQQPGPFGSKRSQHPEGTGSTQELKSSRDTHNIQVLQKPAGADFSSRGRRFSGSNGNYVPGPPNGFTSDRNRDKEQYPRRDGPPPSPRLSRDHHTPLNVDTGGRDFNTDRGRRSNIGPPPVPLHAAQKFAQEGVRQLPPHLSQVSPSMPSRRLPSRDSRFSPAESPAGLPVSTSGRIPPHSPAVSQASLNVVSPVVPPGANLPALSAPELDEVRKDVMHTAAERAKQRRQQEEEEREALKERARRKAQEIEEKMKAEKEKQQRKEEEAALAAAKACTLFLL